MSRALLPHPVHLLDHKESVALRSLSELKVLAGCDSPASTISDIRIQTPLGKLAERHQWTLKVLAFDNISSSDIAWADVIIIQRGSNYVVEQIVSSCHSCRKPVIYDVDDLLVEMPTFLRHHGYTKNRRHIQSIIRSCHLVTVTNFRLGEALRSLNPNHAVCPNYFEPNAAAVFPKQAPIASTPVQLIIAAGDKLRVDMLAMALHQLHRKYGNGLLIHGIGAIAEPLAATGIPFIKHEAIPYKDFIRYVGGFSNAIGVLPLDDSIFSSCKSPIKYFDYTRAGLPCICSDVFPYKDEIRHKENGFLCENTPEAWSRTLSEAIEAPELRQSVAMQAQAEVTSKHPLNVTLEAWETAVTSVLSAEVTRPNVGLAPQAGWHQRLVLYVRKLNRQRKVKRDLRRQTP
jgi:glycosyltransferase involved in cell wall biosynthesis